MSRLAEVVKEMVSPLEKLIDVVKTGCGKLYEPIHLKRMYKARAEGIKLLNESMSTTNLTVVYNDGELCVDNKELLERAKSRLQYQEMLKQYNLENIIGLAYNELQGSADVVSTPLDENWVVRFFNTAQDIGAEELQVIWAKLLAGEIKQPGMVSLRTMENLKNLSTKEAHTFEKVAQFVLDTKDGDMYLLSDLIDRDIPFGDVLELAECGLISPSSAELKFAFEDGVLDWLCNKNYKLYLLLTENQKFYLSVNKITSTGVQLIKLLNISTNDEAYNVVKGKALKEGYTIKEEKLED